MRFFLNSLEYASLQLFSNKMANKIAKSVSTKI